MKFNYLFLIPIVLNIGCSGDSLSEYPMDKRYWTPKDYDQVIRTIEYVMPKDQPHPSFNNQKTAPVINKLIDPQNFLVVLEDEALGLNHRRSVAQDFFNEYRDLTNAYYETDRQDNFIYGLELVRIMQFGLQLQRPYFRLGIDKIIYDADDPKSSEVKRLTDSNVRIIYENYNNYLDLVNKEGSFSENELDVYSKVIDQEFTVLFNEFPSRHRAITKKKAELMLAKAKNPKVREF
jgi:hypothetical protein